jgi:hypothetical protein
MHKPELTDQGNLHLRYPILEPDSNIHIYLSLIRDNIDNYCKSSLQYYSDILLISTLIYTICFLVYK